MLLSNDEEFDESYCLVGRASWDGARLRVETPAGDRFLLPARKLDQIRAVPAHGDVDGAEFYVVLDDLTGASGLDVALRPAC